MKRLLFALILSLSAAAHANPTHLGDVYCTGGYGDCKTAQKRAQAVVTYVRQLYNCYTGFEASCPAANSVFTLSLYEQGSPWAHECSNDHYIYEIGVIPITNPFSGQSGVDFITSASTPMHCSEGSGAQGCGGINNE